MIYRSAQRRKVLEGQTESLYDVDNHLKAFVMMGGYRRSNSSKDFQGGELSTIMGGLEIDLRNAEIKSEAILDIFALMGGIELRVPEEWHVIIEATPFLGGFEDKTRPPADETAKRLYIKGTVIMGGIEIKN